MPAAIDIKNLTKQYPVPTKRTVVNAVDDLNLRIEEGEIFGFLGANGAGKTTTIKILLGLIYPTQGEANVLGKPAGDIDVKHKIAYLPESPYFYEHMTATEVVSFYAQLFGMKREDAKKKAEQLVDFVGLGRKSDINKRINEFSKGMRQRVGIAQSLINDPTILFYDEPTSGLDAIARREIRDLMLQLKAQGKTMFLSSHQLEDVEAVCHRVSIIHRGKLRTLGTVEELLAGERVEVTLVSKDGAFPSSVLTGLQGLVQDSRVVGETAILTCESDPGRVAQVIEAIRGQNVHIFSIVPKRRTLEDLFVDIVGERIDPNAGGIALPENGSPNGFGGTTTSTSPVSAAVSAPDALLAGAAPTTRPTANKYKQLSQQNKQATTEASAEATKESNDR